ncbi:MAG: nitroreductase [Bacteroidia bacterium]
MNLEEAIINRRANYPVQFSGEQVDDQLVERMLELANWAPTHKHTEPWRFQVFSKDSLYRFIDVVIDVYTRITPAKDFDSSFSIKMNERKKTVSHIVLIAMEPKPDVSLPEFEEISAVAMAVQNMWLYLSAQKGHGGYWSTPEVLLSQTFHESLNLGEEERCLGMFYVGKLMEPNPKGSGHRTAWKEKVKWHKI